VPVAALPDLVTITSRLALARSTLDRRARGCRLDSGWRSAIGQSHRHEQ